MNSFIPAMLAVLLAEFGGRATLFARLPKLSLAATLLGASVGVAAFAGVSLAPTMNAHARALMLGIALILAGFGQFGRAPSTDPPVTLTATLVLVWRSGVPFLAFAFSIWKGSPIAAASGALAGLTGAVALGAVPMSPNMLLWLRRAAGLLMVGIGFYAALWALRLIG